eukprot:41969_1
MASKSIYDERLDLLTFGFSREAIDIPVPTMICNLFVLWIKNKTPNVILEHINSSPLMSSNPTPIQFQIYLDEFISKILNKSTIKHYQINYKKQSATNTSIQTVIASKIHELQCLSFVDITLTTYCPISPVYTPYVYAPTYPTTPTSATSPTYSPTVPTAPTCLATPPTYSPTSPTYSP